MKDFTKVTSKITHKLFINKVNKYLTLIYEYKQKI